MKFPKKLKIGGRNYTVKHPYVFTSNNLTGQHCVESEEIRIKEKTLTGTMQTDTNQLVCLFHEILHAINYIYCMENIGKECDPEKLIDAISEGLVQVLLDNYINKTDKKLKLASSDGNQRGGGVKWQSVSCVKRKLGKTKELFGF